MDELTVGKMITALLDSEYDMELRSTLKELIREKDRQLHRIEAEYQRKRAEAIIALYERLRLQAPDAPPG